MITEATKVLNDLTKDERYRLYDIWKSISLPYNPNKDTKLIAKNLIEYKKSNDKIFEELWGCYQVVFPDSSLDPKIYDMLEAEFNIHD